MTDHLQRLERTRRVVAATTSAGIAWTKAIQAMPDSHALANNVAALTLVSLLRQQPQRPLELRDGVGLTSGGISKVLDKLESAGFVARLDTPPEEDRRGVEVVLTPEGEDQAVQMLTTLEPFAEALLSELMAIDAETRVEP